MAEREEAETDQAAIERNFARGSPLPVIGGIVEPVYRAVIGRRNARFDAGRGVERMPVSVISIGNLSVGGTGKTPMVMHVLRLLLEQGHRPCVAMRGYTKSKDGAADETDAYRRAFGEMPIVAQPDRVAGLREMFAAADGKREPGSENRGTQGGPDCIVLDDGFQHRRIARELDVVLIDATTGRSVFADRCLPAGWLREPVENLRRASAVVLTHAELATEAHVAQLRAEITGRTAAPIAVTRHVWTGLKQRIGRGEEPGSESRATRSRDTQGADRMLPLDMLIGKRVVGCCAIGHPAAFAASLERIVNGSSGEDDRVGLMLLPDHDPFEPARVRALAEMARLTKAAYIVVTDKDWSKLRRLPDSTWPCPIVRPELALVFDSGREGFDRMVLGAVGNAGRGT